MHLKCTPLDHSGIDACDWQVCSATRHAAIWYMNTAPVPGLILLRSPFPATRTWPSPQEHARWMRSLHDSYRQLYVADTHDARNIGRRQGMEMCLPDNEPHGKNRFLFGICLDETQRHTSLLLNFRWKVHVRAWLWLLSNKIGFC